MNKLPYKTKSREITLVYHLALALVIMVLCRVIYYIYNYNYFAHIPAEDFTDILLGGLLFDGASIAYTNSVYFLLLLLGAFLPAKTENSRGFRLLKDLTYLLPNIVNIFFNISDTGYYAFGLKRTSMSIFSEFQNESALNLYGKYIITFWPLTVAFILLMAVLFFGYRAVRFCRQPHGGRAAHITRYVITAVEVAALSLIAMLTIRGEIGFENRPMTTIHANTFVKNAQDRDLVLNTTFTMIRTSRKNTLKELRFIDPQELSKHYSPIYRAQPLHEEDSLFGAFKGKNIVFLILESFAKEYTGFLNREIPDYPSYTPFLDQLMDESMVFKYAFANGRVSIEAMPSAMTSLPALGINFVLSHYAGNELMSIPEQLSQQGYSTIFYHGAETGSMGFDAFTGQIGIKDYFGREDYGNEADYDGTWGIFDDKFLKRVASEIGTRPAPFLATIFTLSSHAPYTVPQEYDHLFEEGTQDIHRAVRYSDMSLKMFFEAVRKEPWYDDTLFILMADHASQSDRPEYQNIGGHFAIPIIFYDPSGKLRGIQDQYVVQQADILPTLLYLTGDRTQVISYGHNMLDPEARHFAVNFEGGNYTLLHKDFIMSMDQEGKCRLLPSSPIVQHPLHYTPTPIDSIDVNSYEMMFRAYAQDYNHRVINNKLDLHRSRQRMGIATAF
ncbi:LTA synthase family protein [Porphyromonas sp.]|uniref:LTA synthase family protein n=1 Tax=Porphyromonas sp. TaxID=1924944 RepID=UPI0026DBBA02|nr:LTA synthase family protein [Porphyromonas sp.]MDO4771605.1 LTA synthase family protein [Porphyromonas sp.]